MDVRMQDQRSSSPAAMPRPVKEYSQRSECSPLPMKPISRSNDLNGSSQAAASGVKGSRSSSPVTHGSPVTPTLPLASAQTPSPLFPSNPAPSSAPPPSHLPRVPPFRSSSPSRSPSPFAQSSSSTSSPLHPSAAPTSFAAQFVSRSRALMLLIDPPSAVILAASPAAEAAFLPSASQGGGSRVTLFDLSDGLTPEQWQHAVNEGKQKESAVLT